jgi:hypothetical protein
VIRITVQGDVPDYSAELSRFVTRASQMIRQRMREKLNEPKSGRLYPKRGGAGFTRAHRASAPGEAPASDTKALENSLQIAKKGSLESELFSNLGYAGILEAGTKHTAPRPLWLATVDEMIPTLENELAKTLG